MASEGTSLNDVVKVSAEKLSPRAKLNGVEKEREKGCRFRGALLFSRQKKFGDSQKVYAENDGEEKYDIYVRRGSTKIVLSIVLLSQK